jgi:LysR family transcriptional regulator for metE and metH
LLPTLEVYRKKHPQVEIDLRMGVPFDPYPALKDRRVDVILSTDPTNDPDVHFEPLFRYQSVLICAPTHRLKGRKVARPQDVEGETVIAYPVDEARLDFFTRFLRPSGVRPARVRHAELTMMLVQLVASGQGIAALPSFAVEREVRRGVVHRLSLGKKGLVCDLYAAVRAEEAGHEYMSDFFETARRVSFKNLAGLSVIPAAVRPSP